MAKAIQLTQLYERTDRNGAPFMAGRIGTARIKITPTGMVSRGQRVWAMTLSELSTFVGEDAAIFAREHARGQKANDADDEAA